MDSISANLGLLDVAYPEPLFAMTPRDQSAVTDFVIHHTAGNLTQRPLDIDAEHRALTPPDAMIAYNAVITPDGHMHAGRPPLYVGAATFGRNAEAYAVVLVGNFEPGAKGFTGPPTQAQLVALQVLAVAAHLHFPIARTYGHGDVSTLFYGGDWQYATACPGRLLRAEIPAIRQHIISKMVRH